MLIDETIYLEVQTNQCKLRLSQAARTRIHENGRLLALEPKLVEEPGYIAQQFVLNVKEGRRSPWRKWWPLYTSRDRGISECGLEARQAMQPGPAISRISSRATSLAWEQLWRRFEIEFYCQSSRKACAMRKVNIPTTVLHFYLFHILQTTSMHTLDLDVGVPARGWHGEAYRGHIFWDELFVFPLS